jgi:hypothetical protein
MKNVIPKIKNVLIWNLPMYYYNSMAANSISGEHPWDVRISTTGVFYH